VEAFHILYREAALLGSRLVRELGEESEESSLIAVRHEEVDDYGDRPDGRDDQNQDDDSPERILERGGCRTTGRCRGRNEEVDSNLHPGLLFTRAACHGPRALQPLLLARRPGRKLYDRSAPAALATLKVGACIH